jgi:myo-inositol-1(or 4)-monophosphatase
MAATMAQDLDRIELDQLLKVARSAVARGAEIALSWQLRGDLLDVEEKAGADDLVSQADREVEEAIVATLKRLRPQDSLIGEEHGSQEGSSGVTWLIDPIDGTTNYLYGRPDWAVSLAACCDDGTGLAGVVAEPALGKTTFARAGGGAWTAAGPVARLSTADLRRSLVEVNVGRPDQRAMAGKMIDALIPRVRDVRRGGSAAAALAQVATGRADAYWGPGLNSWDSAAGELLVLEAGGVAADISSLLRASPEPRNILAAPPRIWEELLAVLVDA